MLDLGSGKELCKRNVSRMMQSDRARALAAHPRARGGHGEVLANDAGVSSWRTRAGRPELQKVAKAGRVDEVGTQREAAVAGRQLCSSANGRLRG